MFLRPKAANDSAVSPTPPWLHVSGSDVLVDVTVVPDAERTAVLRVHDKRLKIALEAGAGAAANEALVRFVSRTVGLVRAQVSIVGGVPTSRRKTVRLAAVAVSRARLRLQPRPT